MSRPLIAAAVAASMSIVVSVPAFAGDYPQLARAAGLGAAEASAMSLDQIAALVFSGQGHDNSQSFVARSPSSVMVRSSRDVSEPSLDAYALRLINASVSGDERQPEVNRDILADNPQTRHQLAASAGISVADAAGMDLRAIAKRKFGREPDKE